mgnify:CR=1 FL=1
MKKILAATNNQGKIREIKEILSDYEIISLKEINCEIEIEEDGKTFEENAMKKAKAIFELTHIPCIADDSGICVDKLNGWPGVHTARFLGKKASQEERNLAIINKVNEGDAENRKARVNCTIAYVDKDIEYIASGEITGDITKEPRGNNGFGFDSIFELESGKTLAELTNEEKNNVSSRKIALNRLKEKFRRLI